ncbi:MAG: response regulator transcription factor, partial [Myxococcaceae bacterium]
MSVRVLCIDDDRRLQELLVSWLGQNGVQVTPAYDGPGGIQALDASAFDAVLLDIMLPGME